MQPWTYVCIYVRMYICAVAQEWTVDVEKNKGLIDWRVDYLVMLAKYH